MVHRETLEFFAFVRHRLSSVILEEATIIDPSFALDRATHVLARSSRKPKADHLPSITISRVKKAASFPYTVSTIKNLKPRLTLIPSL